MSPKIFVHFVHLYTSCSWLTYFASGSLCLLISLTYTKYIFLKKRTNSPQGSSALYHPNDLVSENIKSSHLRNWWFLVIHISFSHIQESIVDEQESNKEENVHLTRFLRVLANFLIICCLCGSGYLIYFVVKRSQEFSKMQNVSWYERNEVRWYTAEVNILKLPCSYAIRLNYWILDYGTYFKKWSYTAFKSRNMNILNSHLLLGFHSWIKLDSINMSVS